MMEFGKIGTELFAGFILLFIITKLLGKTQISQITPFEFISALILGELVGNAIYDKEVGIIHIVFALFVWGLFMFIIEFFEIKVLKLRGVLEGDPSIVIKKGRMNRKEMGKNKMSINELQTLLRQKDVFSIREVDYAILESNGTVTVLRNAQYDSVTRGDMNLPQEEVHIPVSLIIDGTVLKDNLKNSGFDQGWLQKQIENHGCQKVEDVFYAEWLENKGLYLEPLLTS